MKYFIIILALLGLFTAGFGAYVINIALILAGLACMASAYSLWISFNIRSR